MKISELLLPEAISLNIGLTRKKDVLLYMIETLLRKTEVKNHTEVIKSVIMEREAIMSTGIGKGFAFPHAKCPKVSAPAAALVTLKEPIDYEALDGKPVNIVFMLVGPEAAVGQHLRMLSRISRMMNEDSFRMNLLQQSTPAEVLEIIRDEEEETYD